MDKRGTISTKAIVVFFFTFILCAVMIFFTILNKSNVDKLTMERIILEKSMQTNEVVTKLLYKTHTLSALVVQNNGTITDFERVAATIIDDPAIRNILIAPDGVVSDVYPRSGNEAVIGLDFFADGAGNREAVIAKETGVLAIGGPFDLVQGGQAIVGRLPVYVDSTEEGGNDFWGLVSVTLKFPEALDGVGLDILEAQGYAYEIWRINPDDGQKQIIAQSNYYYNKGARFIEKHIPILNADWYCRISPVRNWYEYPETWLLSLAGLFVSLLVAYVMQNNYELKLIKDELEDLARTDVLTGIYNRRFFMEAALMEVEKALRRNINSYVIIFDLDFFKDINDTYGHLAGDRVLKAITGSVKSTLRVYDLFARYGGEEFIIFVSDIEDEEVMKLAERIRKAVSETHIRLEQEVLITSASFGIAAVTPDNTLETAIKLADNALYKAKEKGRDRVVFGDR